MAIKPISPDEAILEKKKNIPDIVIECWNAAIAKKWTSNRSTVTIKQDDIVKDIMVAIKETMPDIKRSDIFDNGWMDIEPIYRAHGWKVSYDKPGYNEFYDAFYQFSKK